MHSETRTLPTRAPSRGCIDLVGGRSLLIVLLTGGHCRPPKVATVVVGDVPRVIGPAGMSRRLSFARRVDAPPVQSSVQ